MKSITVDGKEYLLKEDVDKELEAKKKELGEASEMSKLKWIEPHLLMDEVNVMAMGTCQLKGEWIATSLSIDYIEKILKIFKTFSVTKDSGTITIAWTKDYPVIFGKISPDMKFMHGLILAPRIEK